MGPHVGADLIRRPNMLLRVCRSGVWAVRDRLDQAKLGQRGQAVVQVQTFLSNLR
jgi:hypothetical protein